jgi:hypothetical protein
LNALRFLARYDDGQADAWKTFDELKRQPVFHTYIFSDALRAPWLEKARARVQAVLASEARGTTVRPLVDPLNVRVEAPRHSGRKLTVVGDQFQLRGKGGIYAFLPYDKLDKKNKGIFKIGMTLEYKRRFEEVHSYFPEGVYLINTLSNPTVPAWSRQEKRAWEDAHGRTPTSKTQRDLLYKRMERFVFNHIEQHGGQRIYRSTRVSQPNADNEGITEWIYTDEDTIHNAFAAASRAFPGGNLQTFYLSGIDPDTGATVSSINELADAKAARELPNFTGKIIFKL